MKKFLVIMSLALCTVAQAGAQNREIEFEKLTWQQALDRAAAEDKMVFVDCYTTWCGPCKRLAAEVFTLDSIADFYNQHFVCLKYDVEHDDKITYDNPFGIPAYPTMLYVTADGRVVHALVGAYADKVLPEARLALDSRNNLRALAGRYDEGERSVEFMRRYVGALANASQKQLADVLHQYLGMIPDELFYTADTWSLLAKNVTDVTDPFWQKVCGNIGKFHEKVERKDINIKIEYDLLSANAAYHHWQPGKPLDEQKCLELIGIFRTVPQPRVPAFIAEMYVVMAQSRGDYAEMLRVMKEVTRYNGWNQSPYYLTDCLKRFATCTDKQMLRQGVEWIDELLTAPYSEYMKGNLTQVRQQMEERIAG